MRALIISLLSAFVLLTTGKLVAQQNESVRFKELLQTLPMPQPSLREMMAMNKSYDAVEKDFGQAYRSQNNLISSLYQPIYERYKKAANTGLVKLSPAEQTIMTALKQTSKGLSDDLQFDVFKMQMANCSLV